MVEIFEIDSLQLKRMIQLHVRFWLFDLRSPEEFQAGHIPSAFNVPARKFESEIKNLVTDKQTPIVVYDQDGVLSSEIVGRVEAQGYINIVNLSGGYNQFNKI